MKKLIRITTVPISLDKLLSGQLRFMKSHFEVIAISSSKDELEKVGIKEGVKTHTLEMTRKITPFKDLKAVFQLYDYLKTEKPFIVHSHTPKAGIVGMLAAKMAGVPHRLHTVAGLPLLEATGFKRKILEMVEKATFSCATKVYPNSFVLRNILIADGLCESKKLKVLGNGSSNGIDTAYFSAEHFSDVENAAIKRSLGIAKDDFVFVFVGRLVSDKGINEMVSAFRELQELQRNIKLLLVGNFEDELDPLSATTMETITTNPNIILAGYQNDVRPYFAISNVLVFPSYREGFPNVVMQAGAMGLPCIVSNINGCNEIIVEGENGVIIPVKSAEAILQAMERMASDQEFYIKLQGKSRMMIKSRFEQQQVWDALLAEYNSLTPQ